MGKPKLFVFMVDALCESDVAYMRTLKNFGWMLENGALVREMLPVYPSFTYPCHVSIMTGCYPDKHGIPHNEQVKAGVHPVPWYTSRKLVQKKFFAEYAKEQGVTAKVLIGGAVITQEYADEIGADGYSKDAAEAVKVAKQVLGLRD